MLMEAALNLARKRGATTMELGTGVDDTAARGLYENLGFRNLDKRKPPRRRCRTTSANCDGRRIESERSRVATAAGSAYETSHRPSRRLASNTLSWSPP